MFYLLGGLENLPEVEHIQSVGKAVGRPHAGFSDSVFVSLIRYGCDVCFSCDLRLCLAGLFAGRL